MRKKLPIGFIGLIGLILFFSLAILGLERQQKVADKKAETSTIQVKAASSTSSSVAAKTSTVPENCPDLSQYSDLSVEVSTAKQEMSILSNHQIIFTSPVSTGAEDSPTPTGNFVIEAERGDFFYNQSSGEGAYYWVSFKDHGVYLFHSLPTDASGNEIAEEASRLGTAASHGCVRLPRATAKWFYEQIPEGTPVIIS